MATEEPDASEHTIEEEDNGRSNKTGDGSEIGSRAQVKSDSRSKRISRFSLRPKFGCLRVESEKNGSVDMKVDLAGEPSDPTHLVIMINGIIGSSQNWRFAAKRFLNKYPKDLIVHCSESNCSTLTFDGVDVMGDRLAEEVRSVIRRHSNVCKISFIAHSLGGLIARYAIARLYEREPVKDISQQNGDGTNDNFKESSTREKFKGKIAGLEPMNFITSATPHLGSSGHKQVPVCCGLQTLEKIAASASWCLGRTGKHLFLTDNDEGKPPLLFRMASDCEDLRFISALECFERRVVYANVRFDHIVGWSTSSLRRRHELPKLQLRSRDDKYPHIINVETAKTMSPVQVPSDIKFEGLKNANIEGDCCPYS
ncbi:putative lipase YOR059C isoform X2 [Carica papaya]|uniref:putative lipase YOR059C isoform X2 n=1 Tax=Carica papaya TaxID=3649 RepID=UPI000B8C9D2D|nr:putative lipase YOR059C isoform X2 [Carica papaya]